jgi:hypothetical protein
VLFRRGGGKTTEKDTFVVSTKASRTRRVFECLFDCYVCRVCIEVASNQ